MQPTRSTLDADTYEQGVAELALRDHDLSRVLLTWGTPPLWTHPSGFPGIVICILGQQVSLESADAAFAKLEQAVSSVCPEAFLSLDDHTLKAIGFSRQKTSYVRGIARGILAGQIDLGALEFVDNDRARSHLVALRGVGPWTAEAYLLFALRRADAWPAGDLALLKAIQELKGLPATVSAEEGVVVAESWKPWRGVAARMLWYQYLCSRGRIPSGPPARQHPDTP